MPTVTILTNPGTYSPASAEIWLNLNSASSSVSDFKYVIDINEVACPGSTVSKIGSYRIPPRPISGDGLFTPNKLLRSQLSYNLQPYITNISNAAESIIEWNFRYGFQYATGDVFYDTFNATAPYTGQLGLVFSSTQSYLAGDIITINKDNKQSNPQYDGTASVDLYTDAFGSHLLITDQTFVTSSVSDAGFISNLFRMIGTSSNFFAYNGTRQYEEIKTNFSNRYVFRNDATFSKFLTNFGNEYPWPSLPSVDKWNNLSKTIFTYQYETLSFMADVSGLTSSEVFKVNFYDSSGISLQSSTISYAPSINECLKRYDIPVGGANFIEAGIIGSMSNVAYYEILGLDGSSNVKANKLYKIVDNCSPYERNFRLAFLNRDGGFDYFNFNWRSINSFTVQKTEFKSVLEYNYDVGARADTVLAQDANEIWNVSSDFINEEDSKKLIELITSPEVYIVQDPWSFYDNNYSIGGKLGFVSKKRHFFNVGDVIEVTQFNTPTYGAYDGTQTIIAILDEYTIVVDAPWIGATPPEGGIIRLTDNIFYPIIITDSSYSVKTKIDNKLFAISLNFKASSKINLQNA